MISSALVLSWHQYRLERRMFWRNPSAAFFNFFLPLLFLGLFGAIFSNDQKNLDVIVPGIAGLSLVSTTFTALAMNVTFLREQGVLKRMRGTPLPSGAYLAGIGANAVTNATPSAARLTTPATVNTISSGQSLGHPIPKKIRPANTMIAIWSAVLVTALAATPPK